MMCMMHNFKTFLKGLLTRKIAWNPYTMLSSFSPGLATTQTDIKGLPEALNVLKHSYKMRINQMRIHRIGLSSIEEECVREFEVVDTLRDNKKLLFIRLDYSKNIANYKISIFAYSFKNGGEDEGPCLIKLNLERNTLLKTVAARLCSPPERPMAYIYDLRGVYRTAILEDGEGKKSLYQFQTVNPQGWALQENIGKIYSARGTVRLGHFARLTKGYKNEEIMIYVRLHHGLDVPSKCIIIGATLFLMSYDYLR